MADESLFALPAWRLASATLPVRSPEEAARFYVDVFGFRRGGVFGTGGSDRVEAIELYAGDWELRLCRTEAFESASVSFFVPALAPLTEKLAALGIPILSSGSTDVGPRADYAQYVMIHDLDGNRVCLQEVQDGWRRTST